MSVQMVRPGVMYNVDSDIQREYKAVKIRSPEGFFFSWVDSVIFSKVTYSQEFPEQFLSLELEIHQARFDSRGAERRLGKADADDLLQRMSAGSLIVNSAAVHELLVSSDEDSRSDRRIAGMDSFIL